MSNDLLSKLETRLQKQLDEVRVTEKAIALIQELSSADTATSQAVTTAAKSYYEAKSRYVAGARHPNGIAGRQAELLEQEDESGTAIPLYDDYPRRKTAVEKLLWAIDKIGRFAHKIEIERLVRAHDPGINEYWTSNNLSRSFKEGKLARVHVGNSHMGFFYGCREWLERNDQGDWRYAEQVYAPAGEFTEQLDTEEVEFESR